MKNIILGSIILFTVSMCQFSHAEEPQHPKLIDCQAIEIPKMESVHKSVNKIICLYRIDFQGTQILMYIETEGIKTTTGFIR